MKSIGRHILHLLLLLIISGSGTLRADNQKMIIYNCDQLVYFENAPKRAVTVNQSATELLLALGLADRMVGTAYLDAAIRPDLQADYRKVPVLAAKAPGKEGLLAEEPDFVYATFGGMFSDATLGTRTFLEQLDIATYVSPVFCNGKKEPLTLELLLSEILEIGEIFQISDRSQALTADIRQRITNTSTRLAKISEPVRVFLFDMDDRTPYTAGALGPQQLLLSLAGAENIFADIQGRMAGVSWEAVLERDPEVILLVDSVWSSAEHKRELLRTNPALRTIRAVQEDRLITLDFPDTMPGIRFGAAVEKLAQQLYPEYFVTKEPVR
ncbi:MAG: ABC transporter substrate-binding protein [Candidatus Electrothrix sp. AW2]|nr:ABC transporter substrate-binding protein [Candidatus Electrothrix gigas]